MKSSRHQFIVAIAVFTYAVAAGSLGCGGGGPDDGFTGTWRGTTTATAAGGSLTYASSMSLAVEGDTLRVNNVCPDGTGSLTVSGSGRNLTWAGEFICPVPLQQCSTATLRFTSATIALSESGDSVTLRGNGTLSGCGATSGATVVFAGVRQ